MKFSLLLSLLATLLVVAHALPFRSPNLFTRAPISLNGTPTSTPGIQRYVVKYATAQRWQAPVIVTNLTSQSSLPPVCPQPSDTGSEDCLYAVIYAPLNPTSVLVWIHGGSLIIGGANDPMLEGSKLAQASNAAVVVVQYRLGVLGFLPSASSGSNTNLGFRDIVAALTVVNNIATSIGLSSSKVTVAGQSSGATLVRALLASPSAQNLFAQTILHSDTADYAFYKPATIINLQSAFFQPMLNCSTSATSCLNSVPLSTILSAQDDLRGAAAGIDGATAGPVPFRPVHDGSLITTTLTSTFPSGSLKPLLITTVANEGAAAIFQPGAVPAGLPAELFAPVLSSLIADDRAQRIVDSPFYTPLTSGDDGLRVALAEVIGDLAFRCADWVLARAWAARGGNVFTGVFTRGATHPSNDAIDFCVSSPTHVCHQDEIPVIFGTARNPTSEQKALIAETQARITAYLRKGDPNASPLSATLIKLAPGVINSWAKTTDADKFKVMPLGSITPVEFGGCTTSFWGSPNMQFDYQIHGL